MRTVLRAALVAADESGRHELLTLFSETLASLYAPDWWIAPPTLASSTGLLHDPAAPYAFFDAELGRFRTWLARFPAARVVTPVLGWLEAHRDEVPCRKLAITHGDYHPNNVLLRPDGSVVVIDWGAVAVADPRSDLAWTLLLARTLGYWELYEPILRGYECGAGATVEHLGYFEVAAAYKRFFNFLVSVQSGADALGMRPDAEVLMRQQGHIFAMCMRCFKSAPKA